MQFLVVVVKGPKSFRAHVPDLPGCVAAAETRDEVLELAGEAIKSHLQDLREQKKLIPVPTAFSAMIEVMV